MTAGKAQHGASSKSIHMGLAGALTAAAFALRLVHLGRDSLWYDETVSVFLAGQRVPDLIAHTARDIHPPGYYLLLRGWLTLTGFPTGHADPTGYRLEFAAAFLSLLLGVLLVPLTWQLARRLRLGDSTATVAALLITISPFGVWYSQEVRMYTLGAVLGVLCLLGAAPFLFGDASSGRLWRAAIVFAIAAAAGLYTLYYFAFLLVSVNLLMIVLLLWRWRATGRTGRQGLAIWLVAQIGALVLFAPWLPTAWRQATDPPVPPWRAAPQLGAALAESWGALSFGQSAELTRFWPLLVLTLVLVAVGAVAAWRGLPAAMAQTRTGAPNTINTPDARLSLALLLAAVLGPLALILLSSAFTPLYHVRYLFTYAPAFSVLLALGIVALLHWRRPLGSALAAAAVILLLIGSTLSLRAFWTDPQLRSDDHRAAVRELADRWRPGDAILVNSGYAYPALLTYWPGPPIGWLGRLTDFDRSVVHQAGGLPVVVQTGHVDGNADLGWGDPRSDFYALPAEVMQSKLAELGIASNRIWHYRIYDTVNDPSGQIRTALAAASTAIDDQVFPGEANLRVQLWQTIRSLLSSYAPPPLATFDGWLTLGLAPDALPDQVTGGQSLDIADVRWTRPPELAGQDVAISLRLVDETGEVWAASDERLGGNQLDMGDATLLDQPLHLTVPAGTPPIRYDLMLVVYDPLTGEPLATTPDGADSVVLGQVTVLPTTQSTASRPLADFGALQLMEATSPASVVSAGDSIPVELLWRSDQGMTSQPLVIVVQLVDEQGKVVAGLEEEPLQGRYPTTSWQAEEIVRDRHWLRVPVNTAPGAYQLIVGAYGAADRERLQTRSGPFGLRSSDHAAIKTIEIR